MVEFSRYPTLADASGYISCIFQHAVSPASSPLPREFAPIESARFVEQAFRLLRTITDAQTRRL